MRFPFLLFLGFRWGFLLKVYYIHEVFPYIYVNLLMDYVNMFWKYVFYYWIKSILKHFSFSFVYLKKIVLQVFIFMIIYMRKNILAIMCDNGAELLLMLQEEI